MRMAFPGPTRPVSAVPRRSLLLLGCAVLAIHLLILQSAALQLNSIAPPITRPFITRMVPATAPQPAVRKPAPAQRVARKTAPPEPATEPAAAPAEPSSSATNTVPSSDEMPAQPAEPVEAVPPADPPAPPVAQAPQVAPINVPGSLRLSYKIHGEVRKLPYNASGELLWLHDGKTYDARLEVGAFLLGSRVQTSRGLITPEGLAPTRFADKFRSEVAAHFERDKGKVIFSANTPEVDLQAGAQDQLSIFVQLASLIGGEPGRYLKGTSLEMQAVGPRDAETWRFVVDGEELLQLPGGQQATVKLTRVPQKTYDLTVELWLAPALGYLPARIRLTQNNDDFIDQQLSSSEPPERP
jgi:hypothetical protein